jgi:hypothetical protein
VGRVYDGEAEYDAVMERCAFDDPSVPAAREGLPAVDATAGRAG